MAAEIVAAGIPTVGAVAPMVAQVEVDLAAEIAADSEVVALPSPASRLDVTSVEIPARFHLNQTGASQYCAEIVSEETKVVESHEVSTVNHRSVVDSMIDSRTDHAHLVQDQLR